MTAEARPPRFFVAPNQLRHDRVHLDDREAHHARVRRLRVGEPVALFDGEGHSCSGVVEGVAGAVTITVIERHADLKAESPLALTLALALLKADRMEWAIEKATELGVTCIRPFTSQYSLARPSANRRGRWTEIARGAAKQSGRSRVPIVEEPVSFEDAVRVPADVRLLFWERELSQAGLDDAASRPASVMAIVGSEGGFTVAEATTATSAGCRVLSLGPRVLRAETAAVVAVALCQQRWGDAALAGVGNPP